MDRTIEQMNQDLARAGYAEATRARYHLYVSELATQFGKPIEDITRDDLHGYVDAMMKRELAGGTKAGCAPTAPGCLPTSASSSP